MAEVTVEVPGGLASLRIEVNETEGVLLGRSPDGRSLPTHPTRLVVVDSPSVSANHLTLFGDALSLTMVDVGSRHGTWLQLPRGKPVRIESGGAVVHVALAEAGGVRPRLGRFPGAGWRDESDFGQELERSVQRWLGELGIAARVAHRVARRGDDPPDHPGRLPLVSGGELTVVPEQTMDPHWHETLRDIWGFVQVENERLASENAARADGMILASDAIRRAHRQVVEAAQRGARLMLVGDSGVGKEGLARLYHQHTGRSGPFVPRNCSMLTRDLARAELFGSEPGAFTGAVRRIVGAVERAQGGTLFLDELGEMPAEVQPMLLRFLDRGEFERLGDYGGTRVSDAAIVSATNQDQRAALEQGSFRADLWYRLSNELVEVAPLRERPDDVLAFLKSRKTRSGALAFELLLPDAVETLLAHGWGGNFRELESFVARLERPGVDAKRCRDLLSRGTLAKLPAANAAPTPASPQGWGEALEKAVATFAEDFGREPSSWDDVKELLEKYAKPLLFVRLSGSSAAPPAELDASVLAKRLGADRGTAAKQLQRFLERFAR